MRPAISDFQGRQAVLATRHKKEQVIAPLLHAQLGLTVTVPAEIDTDRFGTFTRDRPRTGTQLEAARRKAEEGLRLTGLAIGIASEGTFGPHPASPFLPANTEIVLLLDQAAGLEIVGSHVSLQTNANHAYVATVAEALAFARRVGFPEHGLVVRRNEYDARGMVKGIVTEAALTEAVEKRLKRGFAKKAFIETDLRAHVNPTRMEVIRRATEDLIDTIRRRCPNCGTPGFSLKERRPGLPCELCGAPTNGILAESYSCQKCRYCQEALYPTGKQVAYAGRCGYCNP